MRSLREINNLGAKHGVWGEDVAVDFLRRNGFRIIERNTHPVQDDRRLEIDIVAWESKSDTIVFVEVKQHSDFSPYARRLRSINREKRLNLRRACNAWRRVNKWSGAFRFDVIEIYGTPEGGVPIIDHIDRVELFAKHGRYVKW